LLIFFYHTDVDIIGRTPRAMTNKSKAQPRTKTDTDPLNVTLVDMAGPDDFPEWLLSQKGTLNKDIDLEF